MTYIYYYILRTEQNDYNNTNNGTIIELLLFNENQHFINIVPT